jgi:hypothetical protein
MIGEEMETSRRMEILSKRMRPVVERVGSCCEVSVAARLASLLPCAVVERRAVDGPFGEP